MRMSVSEEFFISKINHGLQKSSNFLSIKEKELLLTPVTKLPESSTFTPEDARELQAKCIQALSKAYASDTTGKNRREALKWREHNEAIYNYSGDFISSVVQEWYLTVGRKKEKQATGCFTLIAALGLMVLVIAFLVIVVN